MDPELDGYLFVTTDTGCVLYSTVAVSRSFPPRLKVASGSVLNHVLD